MTTQQAVLERLEDSGYRLTPGRKRLLRVIFEHSGGMTAEELVNTLPETGRATVYRTIRLLVEQGVLCKLPLEEGAPRYLLSRTTHHHHLVCVGCGSVREFRENVIEKILRGLEANEGERVVGHRMEVYVQCSNCSADSETGPSTPRGHVHV